MSTKIVDFGKRTENGVVCGFGTVDDLIVCVADYEWKGSAKADVLM